MTTPLMPAEEVEALIDELADALRVMAEASCLDMVPLWLAGTRLVRRDLPGAFPKLGFEPSPRYARLSRGTQNRYRQLACWRHAVVWRRVLERVEEPFVGAMRAIYFTRYPANAPPYAWSERVSAAPDVERFESPLTLKNHGKEGCWLAVGSLRTEHAELPERTLRDEIVRRLVQQGCRTTLKDALKLDGHPDWEEER